MAYSTPLTAVSNAVLTAAQWNASVRDDILVTPAALASATGQMFVSTGANAIAVRTPTLVRVTGASQNTSSTSFGDLTTLGPQISSLATGASAIFIVSAFISNTTAGQGGYMGVAVSGATTIAPTGLQALRIISANAGEITKQSYVGMFANTLTPGSNTFTSKYANISTGTASFDERELLVIPL